MHTGLLTTFRCFLAALLFTTHLSGQDNLETWYHQGMSEFYPTGIRSAEWYKTATPEKSTKVIVAILDSGIDIEHPDLRENIWVNPNEIPGNNIDDDGNGYVDDIHGWNFIGSPDGGSVVHESLEVTREYARERVQWEGVDPDKLSRKQQRAYDAFLEKKQLVEQKRKGAEVRIQEVSTTSKLVMDALYAAKEELNGDSLNLTRLEASENQEVQIAARIIQNMEDQGIYIQSLDWLIDLAKAEFDSQIEANKIVLDYTYNPDFDSRKIVGDVYTDFKQKGYGNNVINGNFSIHGTHVAGIVAAVRDNDLGMDGIADNAAIMCLKLVPDGDERDKDVANGIIYAVDNGALVINMSFGKGYSPEKELVDAAMKYAAKHDVLLVSGAGNEATNLDEQPKFPNDQYRKKPLFGQKEAKNLVSVGALAPMGGEESIAEFSNYGKENVDVFAPGVYIYSTAPDSSYEFLSGTSMASPVVAGIAAIIRSHYPELSAVQVKEIIMESSRPLPSELIQPGTFEKVPPSALCVSNGMVDLVQAMQLAAKTTGKAKLKKRMSASHYTRPADKT